MAVTLKVEESLPTAFPTIAGTIAEPHDGFFNAVWQRLESWIAHRWGERTTVFTVEGPGAWTPPLSPTLITVAEVWAEALDWQSVSLSPTPYGGYDFEEVGPYRFTATVGATDAPPPAVAEAFRRLAGYMETASSNGAGALVKSEEIEEIGRVEYGSPNASARALQYSGAADLLRPWRQLGAR